MPEILGMNGEVLSDVPSPEEAAELKRLEKLVQSPEMGEATAMMLLSMRLYHCIRLGLVRASKSELSSEHIAIIMEALQRQASIPFNVMDVIKDIKKYMLPFLTGMARTMEAEERNKQKEQKNAGTDTGTDVFKTATGGDAGGDGEDLQADGVARGAEEIDGEVRTAEKHPLCPGGTTGLA